MLLVIEEVFMKRVGHLTRLGRLWIFRLSICCALILGNSIGLIVLGQPITIPPLLRMIIGGIVVMGLIDPLRPRSEKSTNS